MSSEPGAGQSEATLLRDKLERDADVARRAARRKGLEALEQLFSKEESAKGWLRKIDFAPTTTTFMIFGTLIVPIIGFALISSFKDGLFRENLSLPQPVSAVSLEPKPTVTVSVPALPSSSSKESSSESQSPSVINWKNQINALLQKNKQHPPNVKAQGVAQVLFTVNREGKVLSNSIVKSSGSSELDGEALALVRRTQPFPPAPPELRAQEIPLTVPIRFGMQ